MWGEAAWRLVTTGTQFFDLGLGADVERGYLGRLLNSVELGPRNGGSDSSEGEVADPQANIELGKRPRPEPGHCCFYSAYNIQCTTQYNVA